MSPMIEKTRILPSGTQTAMAMMGPKARPESNESSSPEKGPSSSGPEKEVGSEKAVGDLAGVVKCAVERGMLTSEQLLVTSESKLYMRNSYTKSLI